VGWGIHRRNAATVRVSQRCVKTLRPDIVSEALRRIYDAGIPGRIEWMFDEGFVWALVGTDGDGARVLPRLWLDDALAGTRTVVQSDEAAQAQEHSRVAQRDWLKRGRQRSIEGAVCALAEAIVLYYPENEFAHWWRQQQGNGTS
jgi:hypothetical protein